MIFINTHKTGCYVLFPGSHDQLISESNGDLSQLVIDQVHTLLYSLGKGVPVITMQEVNIAEVWSH